MQGISVSTVEGQPLQGGCRASKTASNVGLISPSLKGFGDDHINEKVMHTRKNGSF
jgi:hypothetical protein